MITVFTPTYNRAHLLPRLYESLCRQTYADFEWLVVDDGSTDGTASLLRSYEAEGRIRLRYVRQPNGGKHTAINRGVGLARGEWFFIVDSDDSLPERSLETVQHYAAQIAALPDFCGVSGPRCYPDGSTVGGRLPFAELDTDCVTLRTRYRVKGDMAEVWRTDVLRRYPFPVYEGERFMSEGVVWSQIALRYRLRYFNANIYECEYLPDGLTFHIRRHHRQSPRGSMLLYARLMADRRYPWLHRVRSAINYWRYTIGFAGRRSSELRPALWAWAFWPAGWLFRLLDLRCEQRAGL